jgi:hypothetical protein
VRTADEFRTAGAIVTAPRRREYFGSTWTLEALRGARTDQARGVFRRPVELATALRMNDALYSAYHNRLAPQSAVGTELQPYNSDRGRNVARKAAASVHVPRTVIAGILGTLVNHGIAIGRVEREASPTLVSMRLTEWPLEAVRWDQTREVLETETLNGPRVDIMHGDGEWIVFRKFNAHPWRQEAALLPASFVGFAHSEGISDWASTSRAHGLAKIVGTLPEGVALKDEDGNVEPIAEAFLNMMRDLASGDASAGIIPHEAKADFLANGSTAWQVFSELITNREKAAARIYLGTDAMLGSVGGAPGVDIATLFGVATTKVQGDFDAIEQALRTGLYEPWTAINFGDSALTPTLKYLMPDPDAHQRASQYAERVQAFDEAIERRRRLGFEVTQASVQALAREYRVHAPTLAAGDDSAANVTLAPTDVAKVVRVREARSAQNLPPFGDERDELTINELDARNEAKAEAVATASAPARMRAFDYNPNQPRADDGKFGKGGGSGGGDLDGKISPAQAAAETEALLATKAGDTDLNTANSEWSWISGNDRSGKKPDWYDDSKERGEAPSEAKAMRLVGERHGFDVKRVTRSQENRIDGVTEWANERGGTTDWGNEPTREQAEFVQAWENTGWAARSGSVPAIEACNARFRALQNQGYDW